MGRTSKRQSAGKGSDTPASAAKNQKSRQYKAGIYARLSADIDEKKNESVEVQIEIAKKFIEEWNGQHTDKIEVSDCYIDLGKTGTNFNRDAFQRLMQDVRMGDINCVIVKDLSRFGRNYLEAGNYIEKIFPFLGVRFIAVADGFDTGAGGNETKQMVSEIKNLVNDMYAKDFSVKAKASLAQRRKEGSYVGGPAPYGYKAVWEGKVRRLIPDENTEEIVRYIFQKFIETESYTAVADDLNTRKINPPAVYHKTGEVYCPPDAAYKGWDKSGVERIIKSDTYSGRLVQGKTSITARDENNRIHKPEDDWVVKEEAHEPLITPEIGKGAAGVRRKLREQTKSHAHPTEGCPIGENIFDKVLYCGVCGRKMTRHSYVKHYADDSKNRMDGYFCMNGGATKTDNCPSSNRISKNALTDILFVLFEKEFDVDLKKQRMYLDTARAIIRHKKQELEQSLHAVVCTKLRLAEEESGKYMAYRMGNLSQKDYVEYKMCKENRLRDLEKQESSFKEQEVSLERDGETYLKAVCFDREVAEMEQGPDTVVGSGGVRLSGGQAKRLALARTLCHKRPVLILDDPFSALDRNTEQEVYTNLKAMTSDSIVILLSHRLYLFPEMDQVIWMEHGHAAVGTHEEIMEKYPEYARLYEEQTKGSTAEKVNAGKCAETEQGRKERGRAE